MLKRQIRQAACLGVEIEAGEISLPLRAVEAAIKIQRNAKRIAFGIHAQMVRSSIAIGVHAQ